jgi:hypothetical protein
MYGKIPERKLKEVDFILSCEEVRKELDEYMDTENRRVNVDSAKKLAVMQRNLGLMQIWTTKGSGKWFSGPTSSPPSRKSLITSAWATSKRKWSKTSYSSKTRTHRQSTRGLRGIHKSTASISEISKRSFSRTTIRK